MQKKNKILLIKLSLLLVCIGSLVFCVRTNEQSYDQLIVSTEEMETIVRTRTESDSPLISGIKFNGRSLFFDDTNDTYFYSVVTDDDLKYNPSVLVEISGKDEVEILFKEKAISADVIRKNQSIEFVVYSDHEFEKYKLKCSTLPIMSIRCEEEITEEDIPVNMVLFDNRENASTRIISSEGKIHIRGGSTKSFPKLGYKLSLTKNAKNGKEKKNDISLLDMRQDDDWILYAAYNDQEKIRNVFSSDLWLKMSVENNSFGIENGMKYEYIELFINGKYWGLYALGYPIDDLQMNIRETSQECSYKKILWTSENPITYTENGEIAGYRISSKNKNDWSLLVDYYSKLNNEKTELSWYASCIDIENVVDYYLFINLIQGIDNAYYKEIKNTYITAKEYQYGSYKYIYTPWDMDITWGNSWDANAVNLTVPYALNASLNQPVETGALYELLVNDDSDAWKIYLDRYIELRNGLWSNDAIIDELEVYEMIIFDSGAYLRDMERWPEGSYVAPEIRLSVFKEYVLQRLQAMDQYCEQMADLKGQGRYVLRTALYKYFDNSTFYVLLDEEYQNDIELVNLLEYIGIFCDDIPVETKFLVYDRESGQIEYKNSEQFQAYINENKWLIYDDAENTQILFRSNTDMIVNQLKCTP